MLHAGIEITPAEKRREYQHAIPLFTGVEIVFDQIRSRLFLHGPGQNVCTSVFFRGNKLNIIFLIVNVYLNTLRLWQ